MARRANPVRIAEAQRAGTRQRLMGDGVSEDTARCLDHRLGWIRSLAEP
jgi:hypothetical protein